MQLRFRRGIISIGQVKCDGCNKVVQPGEMYLAIDEKPSDKFKEETVFLDDIKCDECNKPLKDGGHYLFTIEGVGEKCYCSACFKKKGGDQFAAKNLGIVITYEKTRERSNVFHYCQECCEKRKAGMGKKEKSEKIYTFFPSKTVK